MHEHATYGQDLDYHLHADLEDELMGAELPCPLSSMPLGPEQDEKAPGNNDPEDWECDVEPDDPDAEGFPEDDDSCEDFCDEDCSEKGFYEEDEED